jgi:hypothetical protein
VTVPLARDALTVFVDGDEEPGLIAYGLTAPEAWHEARFPADAWLASPEPDQFVLRGDNWRVYGWEVPIAIWPTRASFQAAVQRTLEALIRSGCRVAWVGAEGVPFCDPPQLFDPECMSGGVLAWMTDDGRFDCPLDPDRVLAPVSDDELLRLRAHGQGLADTSGGAG